MPSSDGPLSPRDGDACSLTESVLGALDDVGTVDEEQITFDAFERGAIWTQVDSTQAHREAWRRGDNPRSDDEQYGAVNIDPRKDGILRDDGPSPRGSMVAEDPLEENGDQEDVVSTVSCQPSQDSVIIMDEPWWKKGKTAPLLDQYDDQKRLWYMLQAGVFDNSTSVHDERATNQATENATESHAARGNEGEDFHSRTALGTNSPVRATTSAPSDTHPLNNANATPLRPTGDGRIAMPQRAALSLAGNVNWPLVSAPAPVTPVQQTAKRKTWSSTWTDRRQQDCASSSSSKKSRRGGRGAGIAASSSRGGRTPQTHTTPTPRHRNQ